MDSILNQARQLEIQMRSTSTSCIVPCRLGQVALYSLRKRVSSVAVDRLKQNHYTNMKSSHHGGFGTALEYYAWLS